tara:strand:- start:943 stop:2328 length:1386 start_codon:yes stop_codon:yes gene_type:complete
MLPLRSAPTTKTKDLTGGTLGDLTGEVRLAIRERRTKYDPLTGGECVFLRLLDGVNGVGAGEWVIDRHRAVAPVSVSSPHDSPSSSSPTRSARSPVRSPRRRRQLPNGGVVPLLVEDEESESTTVLAASVRGMAIVGARVGPSSSPMQGGRRSSPSRGGGGAPTSFSPGKKRRGGGGAGGSADDVVPIEMCAESTLPPGLRVTHHVLSELRRRSMTLSDVLCEPSALAPHDVAAANVVTDRVRLVGALEVAGIHITRKESELLHTTLTKRVHAMRVEASDGRLHDARRQLAALERSILALGPSSLLPLASLAVAKKLSTLCEELGPARAVHLLSPPSIAVAVETAAVTYFDEGDAGRHLSLKQTLRVVRSTPIISDSLTDTEVQSFYKALDSDGDGRIAAGSIAAFVKRIADLQRSARPEVDPEAEAAAAAEAEHATQAASSAELRCVCLLFSLPYHIYGI